MAAIFGNKRFRNRIQCNFRNNLSTHKSVTAKRLLQYCCLIAFLGSAKTAKQYFCCRRHDQRHRRCRCCSWCRSASASAAASTPVRDVVLPRCTGWKRRRVHVVSAFTSSLSCFRFLPASQRAFSALKSPMKSSGDAYSCPCSTCSRWESKSTYTGVRSPGEDLSREINEGGTDALPGNLKCRIFLDTTS